MTTFEAEHRQRGIESGTDARIRVSLNAAVSARGSSGTARVIELMSGALTSDPTIDFTRLDPTIRRGTRLGNFVRSASWDFWGAPRASADADVLIAPANIGRAAGRARMILVLHDTMVLDMPECFDPGYAAWARLSFGPSVRRAHTVICPSEFTAARVRERWGTRRIVVLPHPTPYGEAARTSARRRPSSPGRLLMVGSTEPHKEHIVGIEAARLLRSVGCPVELTLIGPAGHAEGAVQAAISSADPHRRWIQRAVDVTEEDLRAAYGSADVLLQPSRAEGFGLPVIEAASFGVPTVHSSLGSLPEVSPSGGVGGLDPVGFARRLHELLTTDEYRKESEAALAIAKAHSPEAFRWALSVVVHDVAGGPP